MAGSALKVFWRVFLGLALLQFRIFLIQELSHSASSIRRAAKVPNSRDKVVRAAVSVTVLLM